MTSKEYQAQYGRGQPAQAAPAAKPARAKTKKASPTSALTNAIIDLLHLYGFAAWRQNNGAVYDASFGGYRAGSVTPGISDVLGYHRATGRFCAVEVKWGADTLSQEQTAFLAGVRAAGGFASEGRDVAQVEAELKQYLAALPKY